MGVKEFCLGFMKGLFFIFNAVFWLTGLALLIVGCLVKFRFGAFMKLSTDINFEVAPYIMIGCGVFIFLVGFCGFWAAWKEHGWALKIYMGILATLFVGELAGAITGYVMRNKMESGLKTGLQNAVRDYNDNRYIKEALDEIQTVFKCCGCESSDDWLKYNATFIPKSCDCKVPASNCKNGTITTGCFSKMKDVASENFLIVGGVALGIAVFQLLGIACAFVLTKQFASATPYGLF